MRIVCLAIFALAVAGCDLAHECDPDQTYWHGVCRYPEADAAPAASDTRMGSACGASEPCGGDTDYCAIQPGESTGICTRSGCKDDASRCPDGWSCMDLSVYGPSLPSICVPATT